MEGLPLNHNQEGVTQHRENLATQDRADFSRSQCREQTTVRLSRTSCHFGHVSSLLMTPYTLRNKILKAFAADTWNYPEDHTKGASIGKMVWDIYLYWEMHLCLRVKTLLWIGAKMAALCWKVQYPLISLFLNFIFLIRKKKKVRCFPCGIFMNNLAAYVCIRLNHVKLPCPWVSNFNLKEKLQYSPSLQHDLLCHKLLKGHTLPSGHLQLNTNV